MFHKREDLCVDPECENEIPFHTYGHHGPRVGDQPLPVDGQHNVVEAVKEDLDVRIALGLKRYGKPLQTFNGRDALLDAYQEQLDQTNYLKQLLMEVESKSCSNDSCTPCAACAIRLSRT